MDRTVHTEQPQQVFSRNLYSCLSIDVPMLEKVTFVFTWNIFQYGFPGQTSTVYRFVSKFCARWESQSHVIFHLESNYSRKFRNIAPWSKSHSELSGLLSQSERIQTEIKNRNPILVLLKTT